MNNNIEEAYCSFEVSELLFKKGFTKNQVWCYYRRVSIVIDKIPSGGSKGRELGKDYIPCFTHAVATEWLRVNFGIWIDIGWRPKDNDWRNGKASEVFWWYIISPQIGNAQRTTDIDTEELNFNTPQEAIEAGLLHVLKELI